MIDFRSPKPALALATATGSAPLAMGPSLAAATTVSVTALVTDSPSANPAPQTDAGLINAQGLSYAPTDPFWISSNGAEGASTC